MTDISSLLDIRQLYADIHAETLRYHLSEATTRHLVEAMVPLQLGAGDIIFEPRADDSAVYAVATGVVRLFNIRDGKDVTYAFGLPATFIVRHNTFGDYHSPTGCAACCADTVVLRIDYDKFEVLLAAHPDMALWWIEILENQLYTVEDSTFNRSSDAATRFLALMGGEWGPEFVPKILQKVPLSIIASYLGISQSYLSTLRSRWVKGDLHPNK